MPDFVGAETKLVIAARQTVARIYMNMQVRLLVWGDYFFVWLYGITNNFRHEIENANWQALLRSKKAAYTGPWKRGQALQ